MSRGSTVFCITDTPRLLQDRCTSRAARSSVQETRPAAGQATVGQSVVYTGQSVVYTGQSVVYTGQSVVYTGQSVVYTGQSVVYTGQSVVYTGQSVVYTGRGRILFSSTAPQPSHHEVLRTL